MYILRTRFKRDIVSEFLPPIRSSSKVVILCTGIPSYPSQKEPMEFFSKKGFWVFLPRYRGTWESAGDFLKESPHEDIIDIVGELSNGFENLWSGEQFSIEPSSIYIIGSSFGGTAAILASSDKRVTKIIILSPVIDWRQQDKAQSLDKLQSFTAGGFGNGYRTTSGGWKKLKTGKFYNPTTFQGEINASKIVIFQNKDDSIVPYQPALEFSKKNDCRLVLSKSGGYMSLKELLDKRFYKKVGTAY